MNNIDYNDIENFLGGRDDQKYIVSIECSYFDTFAYLIINDPERGKYIEKHKYKPFIWFSGYVIKNLYGGDYRLIKKNAKKYGIKFDKLITKFGDEEIDRLENGIKYIAHSNKSFNNIIKFFKDGGVSINSSKYYKHFFKLQPVEQFMVQTGKRLFKGFDDYEKDLHKLYFDIETEGLDPNIHKITDIGIRDNRGFEIILSNDEYGEVDLIINFFNVLRELKPDIVAGYNSENFDWGFIIKRCEILNIDLDRVSRILTNKFPLNRYKSTLKLGQETEEYIQTNLWGINVIDVSHGVRKAQAINSDIKSWNLKYITKFSKINKNNRVYIPGDDINKIRESKSKYCFNDKNGDWYLFNDNLKDGYRIVDGKYIVNRYLLDDVWETNKVDDVINQASFLIGKLLPTHFGRTYTMGSASQWKLLMAAWSYEQKIAIPYLLDKISFTGGLSRLLYVGYEKNVVKFDFAALYPKTQLTYDIFPKLDITGVMKGLLSYIVDKRDEFKFKTSEEKEEVNKLKKLIKQYEGKIEENRIKKGIELLNKHVYLASFYDKKQLPLKIFANSFFGAYGATDIFNWSDVDCAEETTCIGRQVLRLMVRFLKEKYSFKPLVGDTDGFNFKIPDNINDIKYIVKANHWKTKKYKPGDVLTGLDAVLAEFNEMYMVGRMGLDIDEVCESTINFSRKNYAKLINGEVKMVGNTIKSKSLPGYIEEFIENGVRLLLENKGYEFIEYYYKYVNDIFNYRIPVVKIASKSKVKITAEDYVNKYCKQKNKNGAYKSRQAHMELILKHNLKVNLGDVIYYVNTGTSKSNGDVKIIKDKDTGEIIDVKFMCKLISNEQIKNNPNLIDKEYNVSKYINAFNNRVKPLLVCFKPEIRDEILINTYKDKKTKLLKLEERSYFTKEQCVLVSGYPNNPKDQDSYEDLMTMEDKEIRFWLRVNKTPVFMDETEWEKIKNNFKIREENRLKQEFENEKQNLIKLLYELSPNSFYKIRKYNKLPLKFNFISISDINDEKYLVSKRFNKPLLKFDKIHYYEKLSKIREKYYKIIGEKDINRWVDFLNLKNEDYLITPKDIVPYYNKVKKYMVDNGYSEYINNSFINKNGVIISYIDAVKLWRNNKKKELIS